MGLLVPEPVQEGGYGLQQAGLDSFQSGLVECPELGEIVCGLKGLFGICSNAWGGVLQGKIALENRKNDGRMPF